MRAGLGEETSSAGGRAAPGGSLSVSTIGLPVKGVLGNRQPLRRVAVEDARSGPKTPSRMAWERSPADSYTDTLPGSRSTKYMDGFSVRLGVVGRVEVDCRIYAKIALAMNPSVGIVLHEHEAAFRGEVWHADHVNGCTGGATARSTGPGRRHLLDHPHARVARRPASPLIILAALTDPGQEER